MELRSLTLLMLSVFNFHYHYQFLLLPKFYLIFYTFDFLFSFSFSDHVFDESSSNSSVYEILTKDIILAALNGFNGIQIQFKLFLFNFSF